MDSDNFLFSEANKILNSFQVGSYMVLSTDEESIYMTPYHSKVYSPENDIFREQFFNTFWKDCHYADYDYVRRYTNRHYYKVCLCKVIEVKKAIQTNKGWNPPRLIVENVASHESFDFAVTMQGCVQINISKGAYNKYEKKRRTIMPYLLTVKQSSHGYTSKLSIWIAKKLTNKKVDIDIDPYPYYMSVRLWPCDNREAEAHLKHIIEAKEREAPKSSTQRMAEDISFEALNTLYNKI